MRLNDALLIAVSVMLLVVSITSMAAIADLKGQRDVLKTQLREAWEREALKP